MAVFSKILVPGKIYLLSIQYSGRHRNNNAVVPGSSSTHLFHSPPPPFDLRRCCSAMCETCPHAYQSQIIPDPNFSTFCKVFKVVYIIKCDLSKMQYIRQTTEPTDKCNNQHRTDCNQETPNSNHSHSITEILHF